MPVTASVICRSGNVREHRGSFWFLNRTRFIGYHEWQVGSTRHLDAAGTGSLH